MDIDLIPCFLFPPSCYCERIEIKSLNLTHYALSRMGLLPDGDFTDSMAINGRMVFTEVLLQGPFKLDVKERDSVVIGDYVLHGILPFVKFDSASDGVFGCYIDYYTKLTGGETYE